MRRVLVGLLLVFVGAPVALLGLVRIGWQRHGAPATDLGFLHIAWITNPSLPYWRAHVGNLLFFAGGLLVIALGIVLFAVEARSAILRRKPSR